MELPTGRNLCSIPRTSHRIVRITTYTTWCRIPSEHQKCWHFVCRPWRRLSCLIALPFTGYLEEREGRERESRLRSNEFSVHVVPSPLQTSPHQAHCSTWSRRVFSRTKDQFDQAQLFRVVAENLMILLLISAKYQPAERDGMGV